MGQGVFFDFASQLCNDMITRDITIKDHLQKTPTIKGEGSKNVNFGSKFADGVSTVVIR